MISLIVAMDKNGAIGKKNNLPWYLPADLKRFKELTLGHPVIMGRKTFDSIGRALPNRTNIVITRNGEWNFPTCLRANSLSEALAVAKESSGHEEVFVIGGGEVFREAITLADRLYVTEIDTVVDEADVFFPEIKKDEWREVERKIYKADEKNKYGYSFVVYERLNHAGHGRSVRPGRI